MSKSTTHLSIAFKCQVCIKHSCISNTSLPRDADTKGKRNFECILTGAFRFPLLQMGSRCRCLRLNPSPTALGTRPRASGRAWRSACGRWRRRTASCASSSAWHRAAAPRTAAATIPEPTPWRRGRATARACGLASWRGTAPSAGSNQQWKNVR